MTLLAIINDRYEQAAKPRDEHGRTLTGRDLIMARLRARQRGAH